MPIATNGSTHVQPVKPTICPLNLEEDLFGDLQGCFTPRPDSLRITGLEYPLGRLDIFQDNVPAVEETSVSWFQYLVDLAQSESSAPATEEPCEPEETPTCNWVVRLFGLESLFAPTYQTVNSPVHKAVWEGRVPLDLFRAPPLPASAPCDTTMQKALDLVRRHRNAGTLHN